MRGLFILASIVLLLLAGLVFIGMISGISGLGLFAFGVLAFVLSTVTLGDFQLPR